MDALSCMESVLVVSLEGIAELPLHGGHVPPWMIKYMKRMSRVILAILIDELGPDELVRRLANPLWFQALNNVIGMDWDSSGSTTVTTAMVKDALKNLGLGVYVAGGKGGQAKKTPVEIRDYARHGVIDDDTALRLEKASRLSAKIDSVLLQDNYTLYHHALVFTSSGSWVVIQQGLNPDNRMARRYHILGKKQFNSLEPHSGIAAQRLEQKVIDLTSRKSLEARRVIVDLAKEKPGEVERTLGRIIASAKGVLPIDEWLGSTGSRRLEIVKDKVLYYLPSLDEVKRIRIIMERIREYQPRNIDELVLVRGVGPSTLRALALVSDLIYNAPPSTSDPASKYYPFKYAYAVGGKDGIPYPYDPKTAEEVIRVLEEAIEKARIGEKDKLRALKRLRSIIKV